MSSAFKLAIDGRALVAEPSGIGVYLNAILKGMAGNPSFKPIVMAHAAMGGLAASVEQSVHSAPSGVLWQQAVLPKQVAKSDCDCLWSPVFTLPWRPAVPSVVTVHDMTPWLYPGTHRLKVLASIRTFFAHSMQRTSKVITPSRHAADDLILRYPVASGKVEVISHGVDDEFRPASVDQVNATRSKLGLEAGYLLFSSTIEPRKNLDLLIDVWQPLFVRGLAPPLVVVGPVGWKSKATVERMRQLDGHGLHYLGRLPRLDQVAVFQAATAFVLPSLYEGFGFPVLEAMACAIPVIASQRASLPEIVADAGLLVDPSAHDQVEAAIRRLLSEPQLALELGQKGLHRSRSFSWTQSVAQHLEVFRQAISVSS